MKYYLLILLLLLSTLFPTQNVTAQSSQNEYSNFDPTNRSEERRVGGRV